MIGLFEWDEAKHERNMALHGLDFADVAEFDWTTALLKRDERQEYGEPRYIAVGKLLNRLTVLVFTIRESKMRIISWRKANHREKKAYDFRHQE